ncbi:MAG: metal ABC transporter substrate-binding protein [Oscillibacter sp.]|nr:metal ABC transporter substrate-binding protein [Oscillibacter sp.]MDD7001325.1 metal ABC transporter substrate-binding protein [Oscillibacter sp.]
MKRIASFFLALALAFSLTACTVPVEKADDGKLQIVATLFPYYDFARAIVGDRADVTLLLSPGREAHSFEPTPLDAVTISESDVFLYNGGEGEYWVDSMLGAAGENIAVIARMMDYVDALDEEYVEGMQGADGHDHDHEHGSHDDHDDHDDHDHDHEEDEHDSDEVEYDEHIWTSPKNAVVLCRAVCDAICRADAENAAFYRANCENYCAQLEDLDARFAALCESAPRRLLIFADRFPMLYFCREFGLDYRAAFHGCSGDTEPSLATIKFLIDKVEDENIPVVYTIDFGTKKVAAVVSECTGAAIETLYSMQTVSRADFDAGETYLTLMERNFEALRKGLNA